MGMEHKGFTGRGESTRDGTPMAVIFDPESLFLDPSPGIEWAMRQAMDDLGVNVPAEWFTRHWHLRMPFCETLVRLTGTSDPAVVDLARERYFGHFNREGRFRCALRPGAMAVLAALLADPGIELHYLTHIGTEDARRLLSTYGLDHVPRRLITTPKPQTPWVRWALLRRHVERARPRPSAWALLSDHPCEIVAARRLNLRSVGLAFARLCPVSMRLLHPSAVAGTLAEVPACLRLPANDLPRPQLIAASGRVH